MKHSRGFRTKTRHKLSGGRFSIAEALQVFEVGTKVQVKLNPAQHKGMPFPRFHGRVGEVIEKRGRAFIVQIKDGSLLKKVSARAEHLVQAK